MCAFREGDRSIVSFWSHVGFMVAAVLKIWKFFKPCIVLGSKGKVVHEISGGPKDQLQIQPQKGNVAHV